RIDAPRCAARCQGRAVLHRAHPDWHLLELTLSSAERRRPRDLGRLPHAAPVGTASFGAVTRRSGAALLLVLLLALRGTACGGGFQFREDERVDITSPTERARVAAP